MTKFLQIILIINQLFPAIVGFIRQIEDAFPEQGQGAAKLEMLRKLLESAFQAIGDVSVTWAEIWPKLQVLINSIVGMFNAVGRFKNTPPAHPAAPADERH